MGHHDRKQAKMQAHECKKEAKHEARKAERKCCRKIKHEERKEIRHENHGRLIAQIAKWNAISAFGIAAGVAFGMTLGALAAKKL
jgi:hypothetical protein